jgi:hypothetical protein
MIGVLLSLLGLVFDVAGTILIFKFGLISDLQNAILESKEIANTPEEITDMKRNISKSKLGFCLIIMGFIFQFLGTLLQYINNRVV